MGTDKRARQKTNRQARLAAAEAAHESRARRQRLVVYGALAVGIVAVILVIALLVRDDDDPATASDPATGTDTPGDDPTVDDAAGDAPVTITVPPPGATVTGETPCPPDDGSAERTTTFEQAPPTCIDPDATYTAQVVTTAGEFTIDLDAAAAPETVNNFVVLARYGYYDGVAFHRIIPGFVVQGGDAVGPQPGLGGPGYQFANENPDAEPYYPLGAVAMANSGPDTNGSQFFVVTGPDGEALPPQYSRFGEVTEGFEVVQAIEAAGTASGQPSAEIVIESITVSES